MSATLPDWPLFGFDDDPRQALREARVRGRPAVLATIIALEGGGPRPVGTQMMLSEGLASGFLSGGCLEADVATHALNVIADGAPRWLVYGRGSPWPDIRLLCGARIEIQLERLLPDDAAVAMLLALADAREPAVWLSNGSARLCARLVAHPTSPIGFRKLFEPATRLIVLGADPTALAIAALAAQAGFETILVRPKGPSAGPALLGVRYNRDEPARAFEEIGLDAWTAVAVATHDPHIDHAALMAALPSRAFYVGALGARRRLSDRQAGLRAAGMAEAAIARMRAPIGLAIGGKAPWEVAIATLAEIVAVRLMRAEGSQGGGGAP
ncbi:MAG TPA: XdhC family protein [Caulobacteraceae bacterium]|nr:XdhC family protein [Caulobacteraceae bacterium]